MKYEWIESYCEQKPGAVKDFQPEWDATRFFAGGKMFGMIGENKEGAPIITLKLEPSFGDFLRHQFPSVVMPGYYMNKIHWNSMDLRGDVPEDLVREMIDQSYDLIFHALPKKVQNELLGA